MTLATPLLLTLAAPLVGRLWQHHVWLWQHPLNFDWGCSFEYLILQAVDILCWQRAWVAYYDTARTCTWQSSFDFSNIIPDSTLAASYGSGSICAGYWLFTVYCLRCCVWLFDFDILDNVSLTFLENDFWHALELDLLTLAAPLTVWLRQHHVWLWQHPLIFEWGSSFEYLMLQDRWNCLRAACVQQLCWKNSHMRLTEPIWLWQHHSKHDFGNIMWLWQHVWGHNGECAHTIDRVHLTRATSFGFGSIIVQHHWPYDFGFIIESLASAAHLDSLNMKTWRWQRPWTLGVANFNEACVCYAHEAILKPLFLRTFVCDEELWIRTLEHAMISSAMFNIEYIFHFTVVSIFCLISRFDNGLCNLNELAAFIILTECVHPTSVLRNHAKSFNASMLCVPSLLLCDVDVYVYSALWISHVMYRSRLLLFLF